MNERLLCIPQYSHDNFVIKLITFFWLSPQWLSGTRALEAYTYFFYKKPVYKKLEAGALSIRFLFH